jgi:precorrin-6A/cobalt-precorrin-6A reductase
VIVRLVDPPPASLPERWKVILSRGPYSYAGERKIMTEQGIDVILTKDSGGTHIIAKLDAAGDLGIPVVIIARPKPAPLPLLRTAAEVVAWCHSL